MISRRSSSVSLKQLSLPDPAEFTLRQAYEQFHRQPEHSVRYVREMWTTLGHWERCTNDPPLRGIDNQTLSQFRTTFLGTPLPSKIAWLLRLAARGDPRAGTIGRALGIRTAELTTLSLAEVTTRVVAQLRRLPHVPPSCQVLLAGPATWNAQRRQIEAILATVGPARHGKPFALGLIDECPRAQPARETEPDPVTATLTEISEIYLACEVARWPREATTGVPAPDIWRALVVFLFNVGCRRSDFLAIDKTQVDWPRQALLLRQRKTGKARWLPLNETTLSHLARIGECTGPRLFPFPDNLRTLYRTWAAIQQAAEISVPRGSVSCRRQVYGFHELRKTCLTEYFAVNERAAQEMGGHSQLLTTLRHYVSTARRDGVARSASEALPQPEAFLADATSPPSPPPDPDRPRFRVVG